MSKREEAIYSLSGDSGFYLDQTEYLIDEVIAEAHADFAARIIGAIEKIPNIAIFSEVEWKGAVWRVNVLEAIRKELEHEST